MERPRRTRAHRGRRPRPLRSRQPHPSSCVVRGVGCGVERRHAHTPRRAARARPASASPPRSCCGGGSDLVKRLLTVDEVPARACRTRWSTRGRAATHGNPLHHTQVTLLPSLTHEGSDSTLPSIPPFLTSASPIPHPPSPPCSHSSFPSLTRSLFPSTSFSSLPPPVPVSHPSLLTPSFFLWYIAFTTCSLYPPPHTHRSLMPSLLFNARAVG